MSGKYDGRVAVITGGGRGFGLAFGRALATRGAHVALLDLDGNAATESAAPIRSDGGEASAYCCDVTDEDRVAAVLRDLAEKRGGIDILINNAGLHSDAYNKPVSELGLPAVRRLFDVNVLAVLACAMTARPFMAGRPGAAIVNISSASAYRSASAYGVSKLAVRGLTAMLAHELGDDGIRVNAIAPGLIFTDTIRTELQPEVVARVKGRQILRAEGDERDIVEAMLYLVSPSARFVTGETLRVSGGFTLSV